MKLSTKRISTRVSAVTTLTSVGAVLSGVLIANLASAGPPTTDTTAVAFVDIPAKQVWGNNSISPNRGESVVVIGGSTTVPSNATTVRLAVTVKGTAAGTIKLYPAGNEAGGAGHTVSWAAGGTNTATTAENIGLSNKITAFNTSTKAAVVTVKITGYSTQVTAGDINGSGGTAGQVLTNNGTGGATWATPPVAARVSHSWSRTQVSGITLESIRSVTIHAPEDGWVIVQGSAVARGNIGCPCHAHARIAKADGAVSTDIFSSVPTGSSYTTMSPIWTFPVTQGSHTFELHVGAVPSHSMSFSNAQVQAIFVPSGTSTPGPG